VAEERNHFAEIISESSEQLINIITTSTIEAGQEKVEEKEFDLNSLLKKLHESYLNQIEKKNKDVRLNLLIPDGELSIKSDETKLVQVLSNLINNALKFTMQGFVDFGYAIKGNELE
jgi:signal transduction histidine kinase